MPESASSLTALLAAEAAIRRPKASTSSATDLGPIRGSLPKPLKKVPYEERQSKGANKGLARRAQKDRRQVDLDRGKGIGGSNRQEEDRAMAALRKKAGLVTKEQREGGLVDFDSRPADHRDFYDPSASSSDGSDSEPDLDRDPRGSADPRRPPPPSRTHHAHTSSSHTALPTSFGGRATAQDPRDLPTLGEAVQEEEHLYVDSFGRERWLKTSQIDELGLVQDDGGVWREPQLLDPQRQPGTFGLTESGRDLHDQSAIRGEQTQYPVFHNTAEEIQRRQEKNQPRDAPGVRSTSDGATHYDRSTDNRAQAAGAFVFSADPKERDAQQARIKREHDEVERAKAEAKAKAGSAVEDRKRMLERRKAEAAKKRARVEHAS